MRNHLLKSIFISLILVMGVSNARGATIFNCGIEVNETWYKGTGTINSGNWLGDKTAFNNKDFGVITSLKLGGQYDTWDDNKTDQCSWNSNNGIKITISTEGGTQKAEFKLSCFHSGKDGNNNVWKTTGTINNCGDKSAFGRYTYDISSYAAGKYKMKATWFSPSGISTNATAKFTIPGFTTTSTSQNFDNTTVNSNSSKTISFGTHYGTTLKTNNCSISGTNHTEFSVTSINESGVTVQFKPTSAGSKTATLTITDAHSKKCTITLSGTAIATYTVTITNDGNGSTVPSGEQLNITENDGISISAEAAENFAFTSWTIVSGAGTFDAQTSVSTKFYPTSDATIQANFRSTATNSLAVVEGAGIESVTGSTDPVTLGNSYTITATPKTGYTFSTWTAEPAANATFASATSANTTVTVNNGSVTVTASATENMSTLTTSNKYDAGDPGYEVPAASVNSIGYETTAEVTATAAGNGYTFTGWTLTNCTRTDGGAPDATRITVRSNGDGKEATIVANYAEDLTSTYYVRGDNAGPFSEGWNANPNTMMKKHSGKANSNDVYWEIDVPQSKVTPNDDQWEFKIYNDAGSDDNKKWLGWGSGDAHYWLTKENNSLTLSTSGSNNIRFKPYLAGKYTFHLNYDDSSKPTLEVTWPVYNQLRISDANPVDATNTGEFDMTGSGTYTVTRSLKANTTYTFKIVYDSEWYGASSGNLTRALSTKTLSTSSDNLTIETDIAGDYTFNFNASTKELSVVYPVSEYEYYISGSVNDWAPNDNEYGMTEISTNVYAITVRLQAGDHTFKVNQLAGDSYDWDDIEDKDIIELSNDDSNIKLSLTKETEVTIKYNSDTKKISFDGLTKVTYTDIIVQLYTEENAPQIWWWGSDGEKSKDAEDLYDYNTSAPTMNAVAGEENWYEWTIKDVATHSGVIVRFKNSSTQSADYTVTENTCFDGRDLANTRTTACGEVPTTCLDCSGIYLKGTFNSWLPNNEFKKTGDANIVTLSITLAKGNYEFKIHGDEWYGNTGNMTRENTEQAWTYNKDEDKTPFRVDVAGDYTFSWNISEHQLTVTYPEFPNTDSQPDKIYFLPNKSWKTDNATFAAYFLDGDKGITPKWAQFTDADGDGLYEVANDKKYLTMIFCRMDPEGTDPDNWKNKWNQSADITISTTSYLNCWIDNLDWWNDATGTWTMPLSNGDNSATIAAAKDQTVTALVNRSFTKDDGWYTLALPFNMSASLVGEAYQLSGLVRKTSEYVEVNLEKTSTILAGQPYLILPSENKSYLLVENATIDNTAGTSISKSISGLSVAMQAIINGTGDLTSGEYWVGNGGMLYNTSTPKRGLRVLFNITSSSGIAPRMRVVAQEDEATGVEDITAPEGQVLKVIENGQLIIIRGGEKYNVQGQRL